MNKIQANASMRKTIITMLLLMALSPVFARELVLPKGTAVAITILEQIDSRRPKKLPSAQAIVVAGDVYDEEGRVVLIPKGTKATIQVEVRNGSVWDDPGRIKLRPISTTAFNGRLIVFEAEEVVFKGRESIVKRKMQIRMEAGTTFIATVANDYRFVVD